MPSTVVKGFAKKTGKSVADVEKLWNQAKAIASDEYPGIDHTSPRFFSIVTSILKKKLHLKESADGAIIFEAGNVVKGFADRTGKSEAEVEKKWEEAKAAARKQYPDIPEDSERFYKIVTTILKNMLGIKENFSNMLDNELFLLEQISVDKM